ncbi:MAG TPA: spore cortex-lytic enzyme [Bacillota bacterium]|nr:spore cortex-lytic enzyme [Bacillota bacterium]
MSSRQVYSSAIVKEGSVGGYVWELQGRLKFLGYYHGPIDGNFGWRTYWAVRNFQYEFGLNIDGIVGEETKDRLWRATKNWNPSTTASSFTISSTHGFSENDIKLMANAVYGEARGEPFVGQVAVAAVILNRVKNIAFPNTPSGVIFQPGAFTAVADGQIWLSPNETAKKAVRDAINGWDPSDGAIYYFNPDTATSPWIWSRPQIKKIGKHIFCR